MTGSALPAIWDGRKVHTGQPVHSSQAVRSARQCRANTSRPAWRTTDRKANTTMIASSA